MAQPVSIEDIVCLGCGCLCDDLSAARFKDGWKAEGLSCELGKQWLAALPISTVAECRANGQDVTTEQAIERAAGVLSAARSPFVCGLKGVATDAQRLAVAIADRLGGCVDWTTSEADAAPVIAFQAHGASGASLGEVAQRADLTIFWQCDPATTHPRHFERYSLSPASVWLPRGRKDRTVVAVGPANTPTASEADLVLESTPEQSLEGLQRLRATLAGTELAGEAGAAWRELAERISQSRYVAFFYGATLIQQGDAVLGELTLLAQQAPTRVVTCRLGAGDNAQGAESVLTWQTGYPMAVSVSRGWPEYGPDEFTTNTLLTRGEVDAVLVVSNAGLSGLSAEAIAALRRLPSVVLAESDAADLEPSVEVRVAPLGAASGGSVFRCDGLTLPLVDSLCTTPSHAAVLQPLSASLGASTKTAAAAP